MEPGSSTALRVCAKKALRRFASLFVLATRTAVTAKVKRQPVCKGLAKKLFLVPPLAQKMKIVRHVERSRNAR